MISQVVSHGRLTRFNANAIIFKEGDQMSMVPILVEGRIRVFYRNDNTDRELLLYSVKAHETSMLSCVTFLSEENKVNIYAVAEAESVLLYIPMNTIILWSKTKLEWNQLVIKSFREIFDMLARGLKSAGTTSLEERIMDFLKSLVKHEKSNCISMTHLEIANSLGTTRVVVSRILKALESQKILSLRRGKVELLPS
ncbi:MAG: Crp/Fnr family transcriptional regulator [Flavobacteriales bacterium]|nr:Crp/Fnr family transcriptional regulator [Flavobacteriales bacterium]